MTIRKIQPRFVTRAEYIRQRSHLESLNPDSSTRSNFSVSAQLFTTAPSQPRDASFPSPYLV